MQSTEGAIACWALRVALGDSKGNGSAALMGIPQSGGGDCDACYLIKSKDDTSNLLPVQHRCSCSHLSLSASSGEEGGGITAEWNRERKK